MTLRIATFALLAVACGDTPSAAVDGGAVDGGAADARTDAVDAGPDAASACATDARGTACVLALHDRARAGCAADDVAALTAALTARRGELPLWADGVALFASDAPVAVAGAWNQWATDATVTSAVCGTDLFTATAAVPTGAWPYKVVAGSTWTLDPWNRGFAYDDFAGNADGRNSMLDTPDSGVGHLVAWDTPLCSTALGNCRELLAYLPAGYHAPAAASRRYPVAYLHDGQNVFDDHDCCFGHTGWEVNVTLDREIAAGRVAPVIVVAAEHGGAARNDEYGWSSTVGGAQEAFMRFQLDVVQPTAEAAWRIDPARRVVGGSSLGGLISMRLGLEHPGNYVGVASISGAFWPGQDTGTSLGDRLPSIGRVPVAIYLDHGGSAATGGDGFADNQAVRDQLIGLGWRGATAPACALAIDTLCYHHEPGATHDELAWRDRAWRWLQFFFPPA
ncbi:MAG: alpha/beta hydrolase-fold protein [Kofleriaceae bacterium]